MRRSSISPVPPSSVRSDSPVSLVWPVVRATGRVALGGTMLVFGGAALFNALMAVRTPRLGPHLNALFDRYPARYSDVVYAVAGSGTPVLLLHGLDAGRSMFEWRRVWDDLADHHTVYALDWPGCGMSDATPEGMDAEGFAELVRHFVRDVIGEPTLVVAAGAAGPLAVLAAQNTASMSDHAGKTGQNLDESLISQLVLVCPQTYEFEAAVGESRAEVLAQRTASAGVLRLPVVGKAVLHARTTRNAMRRFGADRALFDKAMIENESRLWHQSAHQTGATEVRRALETGEFVFDWRAAWRDSGVPTTLVWGRNGATGNDGALGQASEWGALRPDATLRVVDQAMLFPHLEQPATVADIVLSATA